VIPPLWRRMMDHRVLEHYEGDVSRTNLQPRISARRRRQLQASA
jgi:alkane 1-monooxygenase